MLATHVCRISRGTMARAASAVRSAARSPWWVPLGVSSLPTNHAVQRLAADRCEERARTNRLRDVFSSQDMSGLDMGVNVPSASSLLPVCGYDCEEFSLVPASRGCVECGSLLCSVCEGLHGNLKRNKAHRVVPFAEYLSLVPNQKQQQPCVASQCSVCGVLCSGAPSAQARRELSA